MFSRRRQLSCPVLSQAQAKELLQYAPHPLSVLSTIPSIETGCVEQIQLQNLAAFNDVDREHLYPGNGLRDITPPLTPGLGADANSVSEASPGVGVGDVNNDNHVPPYTNGHAHSGDGANLSQGSQVANLIATQSNGQARAQADSNVSPVVPERAHCKLLFIPCHNLNRARQFYSQTLGWHFLGDINRPIHNHWTFRRSGTIPRYDANPMDFFTSGPEDGKIMGALLQRHKAANQANPDQVVPIPIPIPAAEPEASLLATSHILVHDLDHVSDRIEAHGGRVRDLRFGVRGCMMDIGEFFDTEGNLVGLIAYHPDS